MTQKLRVWWIPQIPMTPFIVEIETIEEGVKLIEVLARYDMFQFTHNIKPDYCNTGGVEQFNEDTCEWESWEIEVNGEWFDDPEDYLEWMKEHGDE